MSLLQPDRYFSRISAIDLMADIILKDYAAVLIDIDNTVLSRENHEVPEDVRAWLAKLRRAQISACLLSNNFHDHVYDLAEELELPIIAKALKPLPFGFLRAVGMLGFPCKKTLMIGDQLMTDIVGAHLVGMGAYLVCPLAEEDLKHTVVLRSFERFCIADKEPEGVRACETLPSSQRQN